MESKASGLVRNWLDALEKRHLRDLTFPEVRKGLQALSSLYVERRARIAEGAAFDGAGKRAAFALFFGPLHYFLVERIVAELGASRPSPKTIVDLGCGTGAAGAAWALACRPSPEIRAIDLGGWAVDEARFTLATLGLRGRVERGAIERARLPRAGSGIVAAFAVNEMEPEARDALLLRLLAASDHGARVLVVEPIAAAPARWWDGWHEAFTGAGGRGDSWRFPVELPERLALLDRAAGLDHRELTARTLWLPGARMR